MKGRTLQNHGQNLGSLIPILISTHSLIIWSMHLINASMPLGVPAPTSDQLWLPLERMGVVANSPVGSTGIKKQEPAAQVLDMRCKATTVVKSVWVDKKDHSEGDKGNIHVEKIKASPYSLQGWGWMGKCYSITKTFPNRVHIKANDKVQVKLTDLDEALCPLSWEALEELHAGPGWTPCHKKWPVSWFCKKATTLKSFPVVST